MTRLRKHAPLYLRAFCLLVTLGAITVYSLASFHSSTSLASPTPGRRLFSGSTSYEGLCDSEFDQNGGIVVYSFGIFFMFVGLAVVSDEYFVSSLEKISEKLRLSDDVAGATFMAAGSSAPELFTSLVSVFGQGNDTGIGAIVGSAVFNVLVIIGVIGALSVSTMKLDWRPLMRDSFFYSLSIIALMWVFDDNEVTWVESTVLVFGYAMYVVMMGFNAKLMNLLGGNNDDVTEMQNAKSADTVQSEKAEEGLTGPSGALSSSNRGSETFAELPMASSDSMDIIRSKSMPGLKAVGAFLTNQGHQFPSLRAAAATVVFARAAEPKTAATASLEPLPALETVEQEEAKPDLADWPTSVLGWLIFFMTAPFFFLFKITIVDCRNPRFEKYYLITFVTSILWIGGLSYLMVEWATIVGCVVNVDPIIMGLTVLAAGTSVPDALSSILVAKEGLGDMAVSNALGSNVFDILLGLGFPWLLYTAVFHRGDVNVVQEVAILFGILLFVIFSLLLTRWRLGRGMGFLLLATYGVYVVYICYRTFVGF